MEELLRELPTGESAYRRRFLIQVAEELRKVETTEIACFYALEKNVFRVTWEGARYPVDFTLEKFEDVIDPENLFRINRTMIVGFRAIKNMIHYSRSRIRIELAPLNRRGLRDW